MDDEAITVRLVYQHDWYLLKCLLTVLDMTSNIMRACSISNVKKRFHCVTMSHCTATLTYLTHRYRSTSTTSPGAECEKHRCNVGSRGRWG
jgi:hypothetical protein